MVLCWGHLGTLLSPYGPPRPRTYFLPQLSWTLNVKAALLCSTLCDSVDYTVHGILQARILEWVAFPLSRGSSQSRDQPRSLALQVDSLPAEPQGKPKNTGVSSLSLLQWILPSQESNPGLLHCRRILYQLSSQGSPTRCFLTPANLPGPQLLPPCFSNSSSGCLQSYSRNLHNRRPSAGSSQKPCDLGTSTLSPDPRPPSPLSSN